LRKIYDHINKMQIRELRYILFILCSFQCHSLFCQPIENHFTHYTTKDGLSEGEIRSIVQDSVGFLWIGTHNGLCRFDGQHFKIYRYNPTDTNSLRENSFGRLFIDSKKRLWFTTLHWLHLYHSNGEWFEHFNINALTTATLDHICFEDQNQLILAGSTSLYKFDMNEK